MRILFTGATSFAGRRLWAKLVADGHDVTAISRQPLTGGRSLQLDLQSADVASALPDQEFDVLVHFASYVPLDERASRWDECYQKNVVATARLLRWAEQRVGRILLASSCSVYGADKIYTPTDEDHPLRPDTAYALSKYGQEQLVQAMSRLRNVPLTVLRLGYVYGPGLDPARAIARLLAMVQEGRAITLTNSRTTGLHLIHVDDITRIGEALLTRGEGVYNLASPRHLSLGEYVDTAMRVLDRTVPVTVRDDPAAPVTNHYSGRRLLERHGLTPTVSLAEGIESLTHDLTAAGVRA